MTAESLSFDKPLAIFRYRPVRFLWLARITTALAYQMQAVAVGWQVYELTSSPLHLGFVGLIMFIPAVLLLLVVGPIVDRFNRKLIISLAQIVMAVAVIVIADIATRIYDEPLRRILQRLMQRKRAVA